MLSLLRSFRKSNATRPDPSRNVRGNIDFQPPSETLVCGWVAELGHVDRRQGELVIDGTSFAVTCDEYRTDLQKAGINDGRHAFTFQVPPEFADGNPHSVVLFDKASGKQLGQGTASWSRARDFHNVEGFLAASLISPLMRAPFREEDKRVFAFFENLADDLAAEGIQNEGTALISIIMPVFNREATVAGSIASVLAQTYHNFELLIVDDGSTDGSVAAICQFDDSRIKLMHASGNYGVSAARNLALESAKGSLIAYLDSDNEWDERYLAAMLAAIKRTGVDAVYCGQWLYKGTFDKPYAVRFGSYNRPLLENRNYIDLNVFVHSAHLLKSAGAFDPNLRRYVDWDLVLRYGEIGAIASIPVFLSKYRIEATDNTLTGNDSLSSDLNLVRGACQIRKISALQYFPRLQGLKHLDLKLNRNVSVIIPSYEAITDLKLCIESLLTLSYRSSIQIIVIDNASSDNTTEYLEYLARNGDIKLIQNLENFGFTRAVNQGLALVSPGSDVLLLNNDAIVEKYAISLLQQSALLLSDVGIVVPQQVISPYTKTMSSHVPYADVSQSCDVNISAHHKNVVDISMFHRGDVVELSFAPFFAAYIPHEVIAARPQLDAEFGRHYRSDHQYCSYVRHILNKKIFYISDAVVYHGLQRSTDQLIGSDGDRDKYKKMIEHNQWDDTQMARFRFRRAEWDK